MNREETIQVLAILRGAYPAFYRQISRQEAEATINLWLSLFADDNPGLVGAAVKAYIEADEKGYPPTIGQIKAKMRFLTTPERHTEHDAWELLVKAIGNATYGAAEEFDKLPPILQRIAGSPRQLKEWARMDSETLHSVVASNVQRSYRAIEAREKEVAKLPADLRKMLQGALEGGGTACLESYGPKTS